MTYDFQNIERKWQAEWAKRETFKADYPSEKPKFYALSMFPYPSGAGLHVGHPLGYIACDIYARFKRHQGYNVLHPMGYDSFGLPAEQYAIQTGQHPAITTAANINRYREQLDRLGLSFDWSREVRTSDPAYYRWTQWVFLQLFDSWYDNAKDSAAPISDLIARFEREGNADIQAACDADTPIFSASEWKDFTKKEQQAILLKYRLTYLADAEVNWCPALGTVLANDEIVNGVSERGGHPVVRKKMTQWMMRITAYAQRLLSGLDTIDWPQPLKDSQTNWIGRSVGASVTFKVISKEESTAQIEVFTTRADTLFGVSFMTLAPEHVLVDQITTPEQKEAVATYVAATAKRSERDRMADVKTISGVFTGAYAEHPFTKAPIPIWIGDYVLAGYGTGAVMAVPCGDQRDHDFASHFNLPIPNIFEGVDTTAAAFADKANTVIANSDFLNGLNYKEATQKVIAELEKMGQGQGKVNYRLRDAVFSRQRYWGEPFPVYYDADGMPQMIAADHLPLKLPEVDKYLPTETGEPPLGNATHWAWDTTTHKVVANEKIDHQTVFPLELNTMPGWAGSSQYFNRYMDPHNNEAIYAPAAIDYWQEVDLYIGGSEHATGHLLYSRFWQKFLFDRGIVPKDEFAKKLINQGMITGTSAIAHRISGTKKYVSFGLRESYDVEKLRVDVNLVDSADEVAIDDLRNWQPEYKEAEFILEDGKFIVGREVEKMSKRWFNVVNPDQICEDYGADSLRLYEMFLGPLEQSKPWNTAGITGVHGFLKKLWKLFTPFMGQVGSPRLRSVTSNDEKAQSPKKEEARSLSEVEATAENLKTLHKTIKKVQEDIENFSFNTSVSTFMICVNELSAQKCTSRTILEPLAILVAPYAPHIAEELWEILGHSESIAQAPFPKFEAQHLVESVKEYPISFNGKMRFKLELPVDMDKAGIEATVMAHSQTQKYLEGRTPKKVIVVPGKIVNIVG